LNPFKHADIITTTTQKSLRGPHGALIFFNKKHPFELEKKINCAVYPTLQGGPHNNTIAGICVQLKEVATPEFHEYARQVVRNSQHLATALISKGYQLVSGGTDTHLILWNLRHLGLSGYNLEAICDAISMSLNKYSLQEDLASSTPGGVRIGTLAMTSRGLKETDFEVIAEFLDQAVKVALELQNTEDFLESIDKCGKVRQLKAKVEEFAMKFDMPGF
jgi:glycine hydroxymethyltransferase